MEEMYKARYSGSGTAGAGGGLERHTTLPALWCDHQPGTHLWTPSFRACIEVLLYRHCWLNHWPLMADLISSPSCFPGGRGVGLKVPGFFLIMPWSFWQSTPVLKLSRGLQESPHKHKCRYSWRELITNNERHSYHSENSKDFRSCVPGSQEKDQIYIPHCTTTPISQWRTKRD